LRLETRFEIDKKKMNFIFLIVKKISLTKKRKRASRRDNEKVIAPTDLLRRSANIDN